MSTTDPVVPAVPPIIAPPAETPRVFTQDDVTAIATREKAQGHRAAMQEVSEKLGMTIEEATKLVADHKAAEDAQKSEAQKDREAAATERAEAATLKSEAARELHVARVTSALIAAGVDAKTIPVINLAVPVGADAAAITVAIDALKVTAPGLFGVAPARQDTTPPAPPGSPAAGKSAAEEAAAVALERGWTKPPAV